MVMAFCRGRNHWLRPGDGLCAGGKITDIDQVMVFCRRRNHWHTVLSDGLCAGGEMEAAGVLLTAPLSSSQGVSGLARNCKADPQGAWSTQCRNEMDPPPETAFVSRSTQCLLRQRLCLDPHSVEMRRTRRLRQRLCLDPLSVEMRWTRRLKRRLYLGPHFTEKHHIVMQYQKCSFCDSMTAVCSSVLLWTPPTCTQNKYCTYHTVLHSAMLWTWLYQYFFSCNTM